MLKRFFAAVLAFIISVSQWIFTPNVIRIDFDNVIDEIRPVHGIDRMAEYEIDSVINRYYTEANMPYCRTHDTGVDISKIFKDFSKDVNDESAYDFEESDKVIAAIIDTGMTPFFRLGTIAYVEPKIGIPADFDKWSQICEHIILHYNEGWNNGYYYDIEYWEIWNEPDNGEDAEKICSGKALRKSFTAFMMFRQNILKKNSLSLNLAAMVHVAFTG